MDINQFLRIIRNMDRRPFKPHRYLALLAIIDIIENQENHQNRFYYDDDFINNFTNHFNKYHVPDDENRPFKPFFHLKNAGGFWFLRPKPGRESDLKKLKDASPGKLRELVEYADLLPEIFAILSDTSSRKIVKEEIIKCLKAGLQTNL